MSPSSQLPGSGTGKEAAMGRSLGVCTFAEPARSHTSPWLRGAARAAPGTWKTTARRRLSLTFKCGLEAATQRGIGSHSLGHAVGQPPPGTAPGGPLGDCGDRGCSLHCRFPRPSLSVPGHPVLECWAPQPGPPLHGMERLQGVCRGPLCSRADLDVGAISSCLTPGTALSSVASVSSPVKWGDSDSACL